MNRTLSKIVYLSNTIADRGRGQRDRFAVPAVSVGQGDRNLVPFTHDRGGLQTGPFQARTNRKGLPLSQFDCTRMLAFRLPGPAFATGYPLVFPCDPGSGVSDTAGIFPNTVAD